MPVLFSLMKRVITLSKHVAKCLVDPHFHNDLTRFMIGNRTDTKNWRNLFTIKVANSQSTFPKKRACAPFSGTTTARRSMDQVLTLGQDYAAYLKPYTHYTHRRDSVDESASDLVLTHVLHDVKLGRNKIRSRNKVPAIINEAVN